MNKKILIIEDEVDLCELLVSRFKNGGFDVVVANDGDEGLNKARQEKPDVVILDLMLPKLSGEEVCKKIRFDSAISETPILMLTAKAEDSDIIIGRVIGADSYMVKPFETTKLFEEVNRLMEKSLRRKEKEEGALKGRLLALLKKEALKKGDFILSSGKTSKYYLDGRVITLTPEGAYLVAAIILEMIKDKQIDAVGGPTLGADPIAGAVAALSYLNKIPLKTFIVRKAAKAHGAGRQIEGPMLTANSKVILVDDVATSGKSLIEAKEALGNIGINADKAIVVVDRLEGAKENLAKAGIALESIFTIGDFGL